MASLAWMLLEHVVVADVWLRTMTASPVDSGAGLLVVALICALTISIVTAARRVVCGALAVDSLVAHLAATPGSGHRHSTMVAAEPSGAQGPRAPTFAPVG